MPASRTIFFYNQLLDVGAFNGAGDIGKVPAWDGAALVPTTVSGVGGPFAQLAGADFIGSVSAPDFTGNFIGDGSSISLVNANQLQGRFPGFAAGQHPYLDGAGLLPSSVLPPIAVTQPFAVANQAAMLALTAQRGDVAIRADNSKSYILSTDSPGTLVDWLEMTATGAVTAWNGLTGNIIATTTNLPEGTSLYYTDARVKTLISALFLVHLLPGVTGNGSNATPYIGWEAAVNAMAEGQTAQFVDGIFQATATLNIVNSQTELKGSGMTIIRLSQAAYASQSITGITWETSILGKRAVVAKNAHGYSSGDQIMITGANQAEYNKCVTIYDVSANQFKYYIDGAPATPATGVITAKKGRVVLKYGKAYQATFALDMCWRPKISGIIFDGQGTTEVGVYLRNWMGGCLDRVEFRNFAEYHCKAGENVNCYFTGIVAVYRSDLVSVSTSATKNFFLLGERDPNPVFPADDATPPSQLICGAFNLTIRDMYCYGALETLLYIPSGFECKILNGNAGGCATSIRFGNDTAQFSVEGTDCEYGGSIVIDGVQHTLERVNAPGVTSLIINGVGNVINGSGARGDHTIKDWTPINIVNNANAYSRVVNSDVPTITGTFPARIIHEVDGGLRTLVKGAANRELRSLTGSPAVHTNYLEGNRAGHFATTNLGTFLVDIDAVIDLTDPAAIALVAAAKIVLRDVTFYGNLGAGGLAINGTGSRGATFDSSSGGITYVSLFSVGVSAGFLATSPSTSRIYFGYGLPDFTSEASIIASAAGYWDASGNTTLYHNASAAQWSGGGAGLTGLNASNLGSGTVPPARMAITEGKPIVFNGRPGVVTVADSEVVFSIPFACTITGWELAADAAGNLTVEVDKCAAGAYPGGLASIWGTKPSLAAAQYNSATGLAIAVAAGDNFRSLLSGVPTVIKNATLTLNLLRT